MIALIVIGRMSQRKGRQRGYRYSSFGGPFSRRLVGGIRRRLVFWWRRRRRRIQWLQWRRRVKRRQWWRRSQRELVTTMRTKQFIRSLDHDRIVEAIRQTESKTSGEIRVYIQRGELDRDVLIAAQEKFQSLGMQQTAARNGVLIFVAPRMQQFAVVGDQGIHQRCGDDLWQRVVNKMGAHFRAEPFHRRAGGSDRRSLGKCWRNSSRDKPVT